MRAIERIENNADKIEKPVLFLHGENDPLVSVEGAQRYFERLSTIDKTMRIYQDTLHEPHNDLDHQTVISDMEQWMANHL